MPRIPFPRRFPIRWRYHPRGCGCLVFVAIGLLGTLALAYAWQPAEQRKPMTVCQGTQIQELANGKLTHTNRRTKEPIRAVVIDRLTDGLENECGSHIFMVRMRPLKASSPVGDMWVPWYMVDNGSGDEGEGP